MDEPPHPTHKKYMKLNKFMPWHHQKKNEELDEITVNSFAKYPEEIKLSILQYAAMNSLDEGKVDKLSVVCKELSKLPVVCKEWQSIIKQHKIPILKFAICEVFQVDPSICERFLNGMLIYKPNKDNDNGKIELRIADLTNPLEGTFDLSCCGDASKYLSISTGYRKGKKAENTGLTHIKI